MRFHGVLAVILAGSVIGCDIPTKVHDSVQRNEHLQQEIRGMSFVSWDAAGYSSSDALLSLMRVRDIGATWVAIVPTWYMTDLTSASIVPDPIRTPDDGAVRAAIQNARALGLQVFLKPHVDVMGNKWRGNITPADTSLWFDSYRTFILHYAEIAQTEGVKALCIGTELKNLTSSIYQQKWVSMIRDVREVFGGLLTYAANFDEYQTVSFWSRLDFIGIDGFFPLSTHAYSTVSELVFDWQPWLADISRWVLQSPDAAGKLIVFTELGYASQPGCAIAPWKKDPAAEADEEEQARAYEAALRALRVQGWYGGVFWWNWPVKADAPIYRNDYSPAGKRAEEVLRAFWKENLTTEVERFRSHRMYEAIGELVYGERQQ
ncbi:MAG: glycoside hydrolase family 113 [Bacteroidota bacterium]